MSDSETPAEATNASSDREVGHGAGVGKGGVIWAVAVSDGPTTASEAHEYFPHIRLDSVSANLTRAFREGYLVRRGRVRSDGSNPFEYALAPPEGDES